jgi:D-3-phosphoglycerate dehydrogenase
MSWLKTMLKVLVSNIGFGNSATSALAELNNLAKVQLNEQGVKYTEAELVDKISDANILIAGTEKISKLILDKASNLKLIARVGVGVDNIDLDCAKQKQINISYTPEAPSMAVPEFTLGMILNLIKNLSLSDRKMHQGLWHRPMGRMLSNMKIGIVGAGKIGTKLIKLLHSIAPECEINFYDPSVEIVAHAKKCSLNSLFQGSDLVSVHIPLTSVTTNLIDEPLMSSMKKGSYLVNTARGGIVNESALYKLLQNNHLSGAALDVFETEPYQGPLAQLDNCILTSHIGSLTKEVRGLMEEQVIEDVIRFITKQPLLRPLVGFNFGG